MTALYETIDLEHRDSLPQGWEEAVFKYCNFRKLDIEGCGFEGVLVGCVIEDSDWYWGLFNTATFVNVTFKNCTFRGVGFAGCSFTECNFIKCAFTKDNLGGDCSFTENRWYACTQSGCTGFVDAVAQMDRERDSTR